MMASERGFVICDPIHGYIQLAPHERDVLDHPVTQRLRRIAQTGLASHVYPQATVSRFVHSLGAMHLSSRFLISCIENAKPDAVTRFLDEIADILDSEQFGGSVAGVRKLLLGPCDSGTGLMADRCRLPRDLDPVQGDRRAHLALAEAGLRMAALFHDLGHLPFSHDMEHVLAEYFKAHPDGKLARAVKGGAFHEEVGNRLAFVVLQTVARNKSKEYTTVLDLARRILKSDPSTPERHRPKPKKSARRNALQWLHSLIDSDIDVDRADYILRDSRALGFTFGSYDIDRLCNNLQLIDHDDFGLTTAVREKALTAVESFLLSRARIQRNMVRHHKNAQVAAALRYASLKAIEREHDTASALLTTLSDLWDLSDEATSRQFMNRHGDARLTEKRESILRSFANYDDVSWWQMLRELRNDQLDDPLLGASLDLLFDRDNKSLVSAWKRSGELKDEARAAINSLAAFEGPDERGERTQTWERKLRERGYLFVSHQFTGYKTTYVVEASGDKSPKRIAVEGALQMLVPGDADPEPVPLEGRSAIIRSLRRYWREEVHYHVFARDKGRSRRELREEITRLARQHVFTMTLAELARESRIDRRQLLRITRAHKDRIPHLRSRRQKLYLWPAVKTARSLARGTEI